MKKIYFIILLSVICMFYHQTALLTFAKAPPQMNYQGILKDADGNPMNETINIIFSIYDLETGGTALWTETQSVTITDGLFSVVLGSVVPLNFPFTSSADFPRYLGIKVGDKPELSPRRMITSTGYSFRSNVAETVLDKAVTTSKIADKAITASKIGITCTNGQVLKFNGTAWECSAETDSTITDATIKDGVDASELKSAAGKYLTYKPNNAACTDGQVLKWDNTNSRWACGADTDTTYTAGTGLTLTGTAFSLNYTETDPTITDATIKDGVDASELKSAAGKYLAYKPNNAACTDGQVLKWDNTNGRWACGADTGTTYTAGTGLTLTGTAFSLNYTETDPTITDATIKDGVDASELISAIGKYLTYKPNNAACTDGQILVWNTTSSQWECGNITQNMLFNDGDLLNLSAVNASGTGEGLILPQAADVSASTAAGQITWDSDDNKLYVGDGTAAKVIGGSSVENGNVVAWPDGDAFIFGSSQMDDDPATSDDDARMFFNKTEGAFRVGVATTHWDLTNVGFCSVAMGQNSNASGDYSTAMGVTSYASGFSSTAMGQNSYANGSSSTAMGRTTSAVGYASTAMGGFTVASGSYSTAMGSGTSASGEFSTAMGSDTRASGSCSTAMGGSTIASGSYSTVLGRKNTEYTPNSATGWDVNDRLFVIGNGDVTRSDALLMLKDGTTTFKGPAIYFNETATNTPMFTFDTTTGIATATTWTQTSDRNAKENFEEVNTRNVLETLSEIPIETWNFKNNDESIRHMGPMAQDFSAAFGLGKDDKTIATVDADGVALAAIQGLYDMLKEQQAEIEELKAQVEACRVR
ncbi:tail fiber domain-containing protein [Desulfobacterales bacterium HSG17]|nr:tail fiber domain-containing protein [Desulfobacterales bacterium HSG17]